jgi:limonene-1,2-epoxide hydrolase
MENAAPKCPVCAIAVDGVHALHEKIDEFARDNSRKSLQLMRCHFKIEKQKMEIQKLKAAQKR